MGLTTMRKKSAFTLVELLVVIAIVAVLLALLLPAVNNFRQTARAVACASNLRRISITCQAYVVAWNGKLPNNSYTLSDHPAYINPPPPAGTPGASAALLRGYFSTSNLGWFDVVAADEGWRGRRTVAARYGAGEGTAFRQSTQHLWCPDVDQDRQDVGVFATNYGIPFNVSESYNKKGRPPTGSEGPFDFLAYQRVPHRSEIVFLAEGGFWHYNSDPYNMTNGSLGNVRKINDTVVTRPRIKHCDLNYLFFDGHVSRERKPPHSFGKEFGIFLTLDGYRYTVTAAEDTRFRARLGRLP